MVDVFFRGFGQWCVDIDIKIAEQALGESGLVGSTYTDNLSDVYPACGVFRLIKEDEAAYNHTKSLENLSVKFLLPSNKHPECEFLKIIGKDPITPSCLIPFNIDDVYFRLLETTDQPEPIILAIAAPYEPTNSEVMAETEEKISTLPAYLDPQHPMFSEELIITIQAWTEVLECNPERPKQGSRKKLIEDWLKAKYPKISRSARDRIATLINPDGNGGAPSSD